MRWRHELDSESGEVRVGESQLLQLRRAWSGGRATNIWQLRQLIAGHLIDYFYPLELDGTDGVTDETQESLVDADTYARLSLAELDADACLRGADSGTALAAAGDIVHTGPTALSNRRATLVIILKLSVEDRARIAV